MKLKFLTNKKDLIFLKNQKNKIIKNILKKTVFIFQQIKNLVG
jgi:hypothetical protein